jgi:hypothetical protein
MQCHSMHTSRTDISEILQSYCSFLEITYMSSPEHFHWPSYFQNERLSLNTS